MTWITVIVAGSRMRPFTLKEAITTGFRAQSSTCQTAGGHFTFAFTAAMSFASSNPLTQQAERVGYLVLRGMGREHDQPHGLAERSEPDLDRCEPFEFHRA